MSIKEKSKKLLSILTSLTISGCAMNTDWKPKDNDVSSIPQTSSKIEMINSKENDEIIDISSSSVENNYNESRPTITFEDLSFDITDDTINKTIQLTTQIEKGIKSMTNENMSLEEKQELEYAICSIMLELSGKEVLKGRADFRCIS